MEPIPSAPVEALPAGDLLPEEGARPGAGARPTREVAERIAPEPPLDGIPLVEATELPSAAAAATRTPARRHALPAEELLLPLLLIEQPDSMSPGFQYRNLSHPGRDLRASRAFGVREARKSVRPRCYR
ncbi:MAG: hypothetical protein WKF37_09530 [Bryobacteraceae bacterium]